VPVVIFATAKIATYAMKRAKHDRKGLCSFFVLIVLSSQYAQSARPHTNASAPSSLTPMALASLPRQRLPSQ
jgi:hypothetical protein